MLKQELKKRNMSVYQCSKLSGIPYTTLLELINSKSKFENCSIKTINKLALVLNMPITNLIANELGYRMPFEEFKSEICHKLKSLGHIEFIKYMLSNDIINNYFNKGWYEECLYSLALTDYISEIDNIPLAKEYNYLRIKKLKNRLYPRDIILISNLSRKNSAKKNATKNSIPIFLKYNIVETSIDDVY